MILSILKMDEKKLRKLLSREAEILLNILNQKSNKQLNKRLFIYFCLLLKRK